MSLKYEVVRVRNTRKSSSFIIFYRHDQYHRVGKPAGWYEDGDYLWCEYDRAHRLDGPAHYLHFNGDLPYNPVYYIRGVEYTKEEYESKIQRLS